MTRYCIAHLGQQSPGSRSERAQMRYMPPQQQAILQNKLGSSSRLGEARSDQTVLQAAAAGRATHRNRGKLQLVSQVNNFTRWCWNSLHGSSQLSDLSRLSAAQQALSNTKHSPALSFCGPRRSRARNADTRTNNCLLVHVPIECKKEHAENWKGQLKSRWLLL